MIKAIFKEINRDIFGGTLDMPRFMSLNDSECCGWFYPLHDMIVININPYYCYDYITIFGTVAHEMCHYADMVFYNNGFTHKGNFAKMAKEIEVFYNLNKGDV